MSILVSHVDSDRVSLKRELEHLKFGLQRFYTGFPKYKF